jgi:tetratricopeptide (TPR) repeat protein
MPAGAEALSFLGEPLFPPEQPPDVRSTYEANLAEARRSFEAAPENADSIIWLGRRLAYLGRYAEALEAYGRGIELHPDDARMYRHRGHRYVSIRELDRAIADFRTAADLIEGTEDEVEPDGLPNAAGIPTSTLHFNIWYHLGLAHYLKGELEEALLAWNECLAVSRHPDSVVATSYWLNNTLRRLGLEERADSLLATVTPETEVIESTSYLDVLLLHKGERTAEDLLGPMGDEATLGSTTTGYGVGLWHFVNGRREAAYELWERVLTNRSQWPAFGYLAAEAEMARVRDGG